MTEDRHHARWSTAVWRRVAPYLPAAPCTVIEIGCGPRGGLVPAMVDTGIDAIGVDPAAPDGPPYVQAPFEEAAIAGPVDAIVASVALHHVHDLDEALDRARVLLRPGGPMIVVEWDWERFDEPTAVWCAERLGGPPAPTDEPGWLADLLGQWERSGEPLPTFMPGWADEHGVRPVRAIVEALDARFSRAHDEEIPYFFADLTTADERAEQAAIDAGTIRATGRFIVASPGTWTA